MTDPKNDPRPSGAELERRLASGAEEIEVGGNEPFHLDADDAVWLVRSGKVELFAVPGAEPESGARRRHLATFEAGRLLIGLGAGRRRPAGGGTGSETHLLAVAHPGTRLLVLGVARLRELAREPELVPELARRLDGWVTELVGELVPARPPKVFQTLQPGEEIELEAEGRTARTGSGVVWVRHVSGASRFLGRHELPMTSEGFLLPVTDGSWLESAGEVRLSCVATEILLRGGGLWEGLERFHRLVLTAVDLTLAEIEDAERRRLGQKADLDRRAMRRAYARLASVLNPLVEERAESGEASDPLLAACRLVAEAQHLEVRKPPPTSREENPHHRLARICAASRLRHRRVILRDDWWRRDNGPLLAFRAAETEGENGRPVALLPLSPTRYELVDPAAGRRVPVDEEISEGLEGAAHMFYTPLPERPLGTWDLLRAAFRDRRRDLTTIVLMGLGGGLLGLLVPILTGYIFGSVVPAADRSRLFQMALALVLSAFAAAAFQITRSIAVLRLGGKIDGSLQAAVWDRLLSLPVPFFRRYTVGDLADRAMGIDAIRELLTGHVTTSVLAAAFSLFSFALLFYFSWSLALVATGLVTFLGAITTLLAYLQVRHQRRLHELRGKISSLLFGLIHGIAKLRVGGAEHRAYALWAERFTEQRRHTIAARRIANLQAAITASYGLFSTLAIFAMMVLSAEVDLSLSEFLAFNAAFGQFQSAVLTVLGIFPTLLNTVPIYERLQPILETAPEIDPTKAEVGDLAGELELSHVSFQYHPEGPPILSDVSFRARPGDFIALVGPSGAGKSTCLRLILGFEEPTSGSIYFDGQDLPSLDLLTLRRQIGVVLQDSRPMAGDIFSNIVGSRNLTMDDAWEAARMAGLDEDIRQMPMKMHTVVSEGGGTFSGGQLQRLLIARAIVHLPRILLFDEATSALDNRTQEIVSQSLESLKTTRLVVAHRLSTIRNADRIYVMERGRVVESGSYDELAAAGGLFSRLVARQVV